MAMGGTHKLAGGTKEGGTYQGMERKRTEREEEGKGETVFWGQACGGGMKRRTDFYHKSGECQVTINKDD